MNVDKDTMSALENLIANKLEEAVGKMSPRAVDKVSEKATPKLNSYDAHQGKGLGVSSFLRVAAMAKRSNITNAEAAKGLKATEVTKALEAYDASSGGLLVPEPVSNEIIELLRPASVVMDAGPRVIEMPAGNFSFNLQTVASIAYYTGECRPVTPSSQKFGRSKLIAKRLQVLVPMCNDFLRYTEANVDGFVRDEMLMSLADKMDQAFLRGDGTQENPKGLRWLALPANVNARTLDGGNVTVDTVVYDLSRMIMFLRLANIPMLRASFFMSPRTFQFLQSLNNGLGQPQFPSLSSSVPMIYNIPVRQTTNIPVNLGGPGDESEIILADMAQIVVGQAVSLEINSSPDASYFQGSTHHHGMQEDFTLISAITSHDIMDLRQGASISVLTTVDWY